MELVATKRKKLYSDLCINFQKDIRKKIRKYAAWKKQISRSFKTTK